jgi:hypothetical protein
VSLDDQYLISQRNIGPSYSESSSSKRRTQFHIPEDLNHPYCVYLAMVYCVYLYSDMSYIHPN